MKDNDQKTCPACGKKKSDWTACRGGGVMRFGTLYCCEGCAAGTGCACASEPDAARRPAGASHTDVFMDPAHMAPSGKIPGDF